MFIIFSSSLEKCTFVINGSDPLGNTINTEVEQEIERKQKPCILQGHLDISQNWYGYLAKRLTLHPEMGKFYYKFTYAQEKCCIKILLYLEEQVERLRAHMSCIQKQSVVDPLSPQVISLSPSSPTSGCIHNNTAASGGGGGGGGVIECRSGRILRSDIERDWSIAAASCGSPTGLNLEYSLIIYGLIGECPSTLTVSAAIHSPLLPSIVSFLGCLLLSLQDVLVL